MRVLARGAWTIVGLVLLFMVGCDVDGAGLAPRPWLELAGDMPGTSVTAHWDALPLDVYVVEQGGDAEALAAVDYWNATAQHRVFREPTEALPETLHAFEHEATRAGLVGAVLVRGDGADPGHGETDLRYDRRTGRLINAVVSLHSRPVRIEVAYHELGHALGLAHGPEGTLMAPRIGTGPLPLADYQLAAVRGLR